MFVFMRSASVNQGKNPETTAWATELCRFVNTHYPGHNMRVHAEWLSAVNRIHWLMEFEDLAEVEQVFNTLHEDERYMDFHKRAAEQGLLVSGSIQDKVMKHLG